MQTPFWASLNVKVSPAQQGQYYSPPACFHASVASGNGHVRGRYPAATRCWWAKDDIGFFFFPSLALKGVFLLTEMYPFSLATSLSFFSIHPTCLSLGFELKVEADGQLYRVQSLFLFFLHVFVYSFIHLFIYSFFHSHIIYRMPTFSCALCP